VNPLEIAVAVVLLVVGLFVARGVYLIGQGRDVEYDAREQARGTSVVGTGFQLLDKLRYGDLLIVSEIESFLGRESKQHERAKCRDCRKTWLSGQPSAQPVCPNCGGQNTRMVAEVDG